MVNFLTIQVSMSISLEDDFYLQLSHKCWLLFHCDSSAALYFAAVATISAIMGQYLVGKVIKALGRASLIIFILAFTIFVSALTLGMCHFYICVQIKIWIFCFT